MLEEGLERYGDEVPSVRICCVHQSCVEQLETTDIDVIRVDVDMPGRTGASRHVVCSSDLSNVCAPVHNLGEALLLKVGTLDSIRRRISR